MQKSSIKQLIISYSNMSNSNTIIGENSKENSKENYKNISYHNTSIMNPHYVTKNTHPENPINIEQK